MHEALYAKPVLAQLKKRIFLHSANIRRAFDKHSRSFAPWRHPGVMLASRWGRGEQRNQRGNPAPVACRGIETAVSGSLRQLPDDDAGREDLRELVMPISLAPNEPEKKVWFAIEVYAPWLPPKEATELMEDVFRTPLPQRKRTATDIGRRKNLKNHERERLRLWTMRPVDMTDGDLAEQRKEKDRARKRRYRQKTGGKSRKASLSRRKPWLAQDICRRTWERRRAKAVASAVANTSEVILCRAADRVATLRCVERQQGLQERKGLMHSRLKQRLRQGERVAILATDRLLHRPSAPERLQPRYLSPAA
jgi:hypothetical protein